MQNNIYPKFNNHSDVNCFHCAAHIGHESPINYGFPKGSFGMWCDTCKLRTYYDTDDQSIKFNHMGEPIKPVCIFCGCTTPYEDWFENDSGYKECPECKGV